MSRINVYRMNEYDWVAAESLEEAVALFRETMGDDDLLDEPRALTGQEMNTYRFVDEVDMDYDDEDFPTFREELDRRVNAKEPFPQMFASTE